MDEALGSGRSQAASHVHLHPRLALIQLEDSRWQVTGQACPLWIAAFGAEHCGLTRGGSGPPLQGWYSERFGELQPNTVLTLGRNTELPFVIGYVIFKRHAGAARSFSGPEGIRIEVDHESRAYALTMGAGGIPVFT